MPINYYEESIKLVKPELITLNLSLHMSHPQASSVVVYERA